MARENTLTIRLSDVELQALDDRKPPGMSRADWVRAQIAATVRPDGADDIPSREQVLAALWQMTQRGSVSAAVSLARELRDNAAAGYVDGDLLSRLLADAD